MASAIERLGTQIRRIGDTQQSVQAQPEIMSSREDHSGGHGSGSGLCRQRIGGENQSVSRLSKRLPRTVGMNRRFLERIGAHSQDCAGSDRNCHSRAAGEVAELKKLSAGKQS